MLFSAATAMWRRYLSTAVSTAKSLTIETAEAAPRMSRFVERKIRSTTPGTLPIAPIKKYKPTSNGMRHRAITDKSINLWPCRPESSLTVRLNMKAGRNNTGQITIRGRKAPKHRRQYRKIDFRRQRTDPATVLRFEYDPNRSAFIALIQYNSDATKSYILAPQDLPVGATVQCGPGAAFSPGNAFELKDIPDGAIIHNIELIPGRGGQMVRAAGTSAKLQSRDDRYVTIKLTSGEIRKVLLRCKATIGALSNPLHGVQVLGKAGASFWIGRRPKVRGVAMNPVDHPMGGGEGKSSGGRPSCSPWGWYTKGLRTRNTKKSSSKLILRRRNHDKLQLATINRGSW